MCGRFTLKTPVIQWLQSLFPHFSDRADAIQQALIAEEPRLVEPRFNIAPTQSIVIGLIDPNTHELAFQSAHWGLVPHWADDTKIGNQMINARSETLGEKPSFRGLLVKHRCIIVADGYYEWRASSERAKQPFWIHTDHERPFAMAGLWSINTKINPARAYCSTTIITTDSNADTSSVHHRMPAILEDATAISDWLDPSLNESSAVLERLAPHRNGFLQLRPVSTQVNSPRNDAAELIEPQVH